MPDHEPSPREALRLRQIAETRLREGWTTAKVGWTTGGDALASLHKLASNQESAAEALKFLHEFQVFQVEIDLQYEQLEQSRAELAEQFGQYFELFERVAIGLLTLDEGGRIAVANPRAARLLGVDLQSMPGQRLEALISIAGRTALAAALVSLQGGAEESRCQVQAAQGDDTARELSLTVTRSRDGAAWMVVLAEVAPR
ncbi:MAG: PAS domain-containing protein [Gammaproteobacteria bacterium]|jgi:nitrogen fixation/metabolism regulation signal transduction histidine kinase|nr:PAS domain-containing protein [Gammaproteobacteria bacterium]